MSDQYTISQGDLSLGNNYTITFVPGKYTVTDKLPQPDFKFGDGLISKTYGDEPFTVAATGAAEGSTVSYTSDKTSVATVDSDGHVTIVGAGEATYHGHCRRDGGLCQRQRVLHPDGGPSRA